MSRVPARRPALVVVGDVMVDVAVRAEALARGGDVPGSVRIRAGGAGANAAAWAAFAGARAVLYARVGDDPAGDLLERLLARAGVRSRLARDPAVATGAMLVVAEAGERSMVADRGANARLAPADLPARLTADAVLLSAYALFDPGSEPAAQAALARADAPHVAVDAASWPLVEAYGAGRFLEATAGATVLLANGREAEALTGARREAAARALAAHYPIACVKLGSAGALVAEGSSVLHEPAAPGVEVDPTGAGDAFDAAFLVVLASGGSVAGALRAGCRAGALAVSRAEAWPPGDGDVREGAAARAGAGGAGRPRDE